MDTNILIKRKIVMALFGIISTSLFAQNSTKVNITEGLQSSALKTTIEKNATTALTELNKAYVESRKPNIPTGLTNDARTIVLAMWETSPFRCPETLIQEKALRNVHGGFEIRNIPIIVKEAKPDNQYQEMAMIFTSEGNLQEMYYTLEMNQYLSLKASSDTVADYRRRQVIIDFMEKFRTAYNRKDIGLISSVYSDDALIIVGKVIKQQKIDAATNVGIPKQKVEFVRLSKENYIKNLKSCFAANQYINISFSGIELVRHNKYPEIYGVSLKQDWSSTNYSDTGFLFLMIDFKNEDSPIIRVRTWEPEKGAKGETITTESTRFHLGNFDVIR
jgi:hypothetical protein